MWCYGHPGEGDAVQLLHVHPGRWDKAGKLRAKRHLMSGYRLYPRGQVLELRRKIHEAEAAS
jgi:hypothetical protein